MSSNMASRQIDSLRQGQGSEWRFPYHESLLPSQGITEPEFLISTQCFGHVRTSLDMLTKISKMESPFSRRGMRNADKACQVGRGR